jgi:hypothetical protein
LHFFQRGGIRNEQGWLVGACGGFEQGCRRVEVQC